jgi:hypothetical protein
MTVQSNNKNIFYFKDSDDKWYEINKVTGTRTEIKDTIKCNCLDYCDRERIQYDGD